MLKEVAVVAAEVASMVRKLSLNEHEDTRILWENVFAEDTKEFLEYYYAHVADHNSIYVIEDIEDIEENKEDKDSDDRQIVSMLHLNPYLANINNEESLIHYIVAVSTLESYRSRGYMRKLLLKAFDDMYRNREVFTYLMPAAEAIYSPYDFVTVYEQSHYELLDDKNVVNYLHDRLRIDIEIAKDDLTELETFAEKAAKSHYSIYTKHDRGYLAGLVKEQASQNGGVYIFRDTGTGSIVGYCFVARENGIFIREIVLETDDWSSEQFIEQLLEDKILRTKDNTKIMIRPIHMEEFLNKFALDLCRLEIPRTISIQDSFIMGNTGTYVYSEDSRKWSKVSSETSENLYDMKALTYLLAENQRFMLNEIV